MFVDEVQLCRAGLRSRCVQILAAGRPRNGTKGYIPLHRRTGSSTSWTGLNVFEGGRSPEEASKGSTLGIYRHSVPAMIQACNGAKLLAMAPASSAISDCSLDDRNIHVWSLRLGVSDELVAACNSVLDAQEKERADRFRFSEHRREFIVAHGVLRMLLAQYCGVCPRAIEFSYGKRQKPQLQSPRADLHFNLSHTDGLVVYAFARGVDIGVDVEHIRPIVEVTDLAGRHFCAEEAEDLRMLDPETRQRAFFLCWTRKEAYIKAVGDGLFCALDSFRVTLDPAAPARLLHVANSAREAMHFSMHDLSLWPNYAGALVYRAVERKVVCGTLEDADEAVALLPR